MKKFETVDGTQENTSSDRVTRQSWWARVSWNWLQFLVLLVLLGAGLLWLGIQQRQELQELSQEQRETALATASEQRQNTLLNNYTDAISNMLLHDNLLHAGVEDVAKRVTDARTQEVLRSLDALHKASVLRFLYQTNLINNDYHIVRMAQVDLREARLAQIDLRDTYLVGANMYEVDLRSAILSDATLTFVDFSNANLEGANLQAADMHNVNLTGADLTRANLKDAVGVSMEQLAKAKSLKGAILPDGSVHA